MADVIIRVSYQTNGTLGLLVTCETVDTTPIETPLNLNFRIDINGQIYRYKRIRIRRRQDYGYTCILIRRLTVGTRTAVEVIYTYPLRPPYALAETRTVIMFPNLPAIGLRPYKAPNILDYIRPYLYRIRQPVMTVVNVLVHLIMNPFKTIPAILFVGLLVSIILIVITVPLVLLSLLLYLLWEIQLFLVYLIIWMPLLSWMIVLSVVFLLL